MTPFIDFIPIEGSTWQASIVFVSLTATKVWKFIAAGLSASSLLILSSSHRSQDGFAGWLGSGEYQPWRHQHVYSANHRRYPVVVVQLRTHGCLGRRRGLRGRSQPVECRSVPGCRWGQESTRCWGKGRAFHGLRHPELEPRSARRRHGCWKGRRFYAAWWTALQSYMLRWTGRYRWNLLKTVVSWYGFRNRVSLFHLEQCMNFSFFSSDEMGYVCFPTRQESVHACMSLAVRGRWLDRLSHTAVLLANLSHYFAKCAASRMDAHSIRDPGIAR